MPADASFNFDNPIQGVRWGLLGSGLVEAGTTVTFGGIVINDNSSGNDVDVFGNNFRANGRLDLTVPDRALAGPVKVETAGGSFQVNSIPIAEQTSVGLSSIAASAAQGTPANAAIASANAGQLITLQGFGFTTSSNIVFTGVAEDGTRSQIVVRPSSVASSTQMTVVVPALAVTGPVTIAGAEPRPCSCRSCPHSTASAQMA